MILVKKAEKSLIQSLVPYCSEYKTMVFFLRNTSEKSNLDFYISKIHPQQ